MAWSCFETFGKYSACCHWWSMDKVSLPFRPVSSLLSAFIQFDSLSSSAGQWTVGHSDQMASTQSQSQRKHSFSSQSSQSSDWSRQITWPEYWPLIGQDRSRDLNTGLWLVRSQTCDSDPRPRCWQYRMLVLTLENGSGAPRVLVYCLWGISGVHSLEAGPAWAGWWAMGLVRVEWVNPETQC